MGLKTETVKEALNFLLERNLLNSIEKEQDKWRAYHTSIKGKEALNHFYHLITHFFSDHTKPPKFRKFG